MFRKWLCSIAVATVSFVPMVVSAADDPSMHDIYEAANSGKMAQAQEMIGTVLKDHPNSAKAHYVAAELDAKQGQYAGAREQLQAAERLAPGLPFAKPDAVRALKSEIGGAAPATSTRGFAPPASPAPHRSGGLSPGLLILIVAGVGFVIWLLVRRRTAPSYPIANGPTGNYGPAGYGGYGSNLPPQGGGMGSGIAGGLASGLAVGAGVVAGEAIAHRLMGDGERERDRYVGGDSSDRGDSRGNADMGGNDFGVSDSSSWDDSSSSSDSGGGDSDDWS